MSNVSRRSLLTSVGIGGAAALVTRDAKAQEPRQLAYVFLNGEEAAFIEAAVARLIPADDKWGGAIEAAVSTYIDRQLAGAWGAGERLYRSGPWKPRSPSQGYQLPCTPAVCLSYYEISLL
jgi:gluconate 2-dehydrogenase gamma chain